MVKKIWILLILLLFSGCMRSIPSLFPPHYTLDIELFRNHTWEPGLSALLASALKEEALHWGVSPGKGTQKLKGEIESLEEIPLLYDEEEKVLQYRMEIEVKVRLEEADSIRWKKKFKESVIYFTTGRWKESKREVEKRLCQRLARKILWELSKGIHESSPIS